MKITQVEIGYGRTVNMENFNSLRVDVTFTATVDDGDDAHQIVADLQQEAREHARTEITRIVDIEG